MLEAGQAFAELYGIVSRLREPDGCPWDREQNPPSIRKHLLEEVYELIEAVDENDIDHTREELGDIHMVCAMFAAIYENEKKFTMAEVLEEAVAKLVRRHPHVFAESDVRTADEVMTQWEHIKATVEGRAAKQNSILDSVPKTFPPLARATKIQKKVSKVGFDWDNSDAVWEKLHEELDEIKAAHRNLQADKSEEHRRALELEIGDALFALVNLSRHLDIDASLALNTSTDKFVKRFHHIEAKMKEAGLELSKENIDKMEEFWQEAKSQKK